MTERLVASAELMPVLELLKGNVLEERINTLAEIADGGKIGEGGSRLALTSTEISARKCLIRWMEEAGMRVEEFPLGLIGTYEGLNPTLPGIGFGSHFDTVPSGGRYDGTAGVVAAIEVVKALQKNRRRCKRPLKVFAMTGEESSRFGTALFGSQGIFLGLSDNVLNMHRPEDISIRQALENFGFDPEQVRLPVVTKDSLRAFLELHVEQHSLLDHEGMDVAAVEAIAAPDRRIITIGQPLAEVVKEVSNVTKGIRIDIMGKGGHSGALPMGREYRADGLQPAANFLMVLPAAFDRIFKNKNIKIFITDLQIEGAALNKVPGNTHLEIMLSGENEKDLEEAEVFILTYLKKLNRYYGPEKDHWPRFITNPLSASKLVEKQLPSKYHFEPEQLLPCFKTAGKIIQAVNQICTRYDTRKIVGTIGTFHLRSDGLIDLGLDLRGIDKGLRDQVAEEINKQIDQISLRERVNTRISEPLPGSESPTIMDSQLVNNIEQLALSLGLKVRRMHSAAGHDAQNAARAGIPTGMIFIPSRNEGRSHVPEEYSAPEDLENGARLLATTVYKLANE